MKIEKALTYDDVGIIPLYSDILSRSECNLSTWITKKIKMKIPIISSPMDTVTELEMAIELLKIGGCGIVHRFMSIKDQAKIVRSLANNATDQVPIAAAIGVTNNYFERAQELVKSGTNILLLDVAHGHHILVKNALEKLKNELPNTEIIAGSIATAEAAHDLCEWGADGLRIGIGNGSLCETRIRTGVGIPQISAIIDCGDIADSYGVPIIADGGIRTPGDVAKALAAGAQSVMLGSLLSGTKETPGDIQRTGKWPDEQLFKNYRGSASQSSKMDRGEGDKNIEGTSKVTPYKGKVKRIIDDINDGVRSSMSYVGALTIDEFERKANLIEVTDAGVVEAQPHGVL